MSKSLVSPKSGRMLFFGVALALGLLSSTPASAQQSYAEILDWYGRLMEAQIPKIRERIRPNMTPAERKINDQVRFRVIRDDVSNASAYVDPRSGRRIIEIHVGLIRATEIMAETRAYAFVNQGSPVPGQYLAYVVQEIDKRRANPMSARDLGNIESFTAFVGMDEAQRDRFRSNPTVEQFIEHEMNSSLMWLIGHELGHHFLNHRRQRDVNRQRAQEDKADDIARRLMRGGATDYNPYFTLPILLTFAIWEPEAHLRETTRTHSAPLTRMERNIRAGADELLSDADFRRYLRKTGQETQFRQQIEQDVKNIRQLRLPGW